MVVAGLVPATPIVLALCLSIQDRWDKPGGDTGDNSTRLKYAL